MAGATKTGFYEGGGARRLFLAALVALVILDVAMWLMLDSESPPSATPEVVPAPGPRFLAGKAVSKEDLRTLRWEDIGDLARAVGARPEDIERVINLGLNVASHPVTYLRALLLLTQSRPAESLVTFDTIPLQRIPPAYLYAPFRLQQTLQPERPNPYLSALRVAVTQEQVPALISARVQVNDGNLAVAFTSYLQSDPAGWASVDVKSLTQLARHEGLATDLAKLVAGALASGRVKDKYIPQLQQLAAGPDTIDIEFFRQKIQREVAANTAQGKLLIASARELLLNRKMFLQQEYSTLVVKYLGADALSLPTETVLLLFLAANKVEERLEAERWGQELIRRHDETEVRNWVQQQMAVAK